MQLEAVVVNRKWQSCARELHMSRILLVAPQADGAQENSEWTGFHSFKLVKTILLLFIIAAGLIRGAILCFFWRLATMEVVNLIFPKRAFLRESRAVLHTRFAVVYTACYLWVKSQDHPRVQGLRVSVQKAHHPERHCSCRGVAQEVIQPLSQWEDVELL